MTATGTLLWNGVKNIIFHARLLSFFWNFRCGLKCIDWMLCLELMHVFSSKKLKRWTLQFCNLELWFCILEIRFLDEFECILVWWIQLHELYVLEILQTKTNKKNGWKGHDPGLTGQYYLKRTSWCGVCFAITGKLGHPGLQHTCTNSRRRDNWGFRHPGENCISILNVIFFV